MSLAISRILHAGYLFACDGTTIAFDPIFESPFSTNCHAFPAVRFDRAQIQELRLDAVFISHFHDDHCSLESLALLHRDTPIHLFCVFEGLHDLIRALGFTRVFEIRLGVPIHVGPLEVTPHRALDADVDAIFAVRAAGLSVLNVVDAWIDPDTLEALAESAPWDVVLWPFQTMRELEVLSPARRRLADEVPSGGAEDEDPIPVEWRAQLRALAPRIVVPSSCQLQLEPWSWYNRAFFPISYRRFGEWIAGVVPDARLLRLDPGVSVRLDARGPVTALPPVPWIERLDDGAEVDYVYDPDTTPPPTSEIARHLAPLTDAETARVLDYCERGILERHRALEPLDEGYFAAPQIWRLTVHDHAGHARAFHYAIDGGGDIEPTDTAAPPTWTTDVPLAKLLAALERGESLTSMYLRVNDATFAPEIERALAGGDVLEDPLIRCLFTGGVFAAYQKAQLTKLLGT